MEPVWPVEFGKYQVDGGRAHHIECLFLVKECYCPLFILGIDQINDHLDIDYVLLPISAWDESSLVVANFSGQDGAQPGSPISYN
jgi:hypothetical protein